MAEFRGRQCLERRRRGRSGDGDGYDGGGCAGGVFRWRGLGQRGGTLANLTKYPTGSFARVIAISDLNGDGLPDLALARETSVGAVLGRGDGTFGKLVASPVTAKITTLSFGVGDLNSDGKPDLALATGGVGSCADKVNVLLGKGDGTFAAR